MLGELVHATLAVLALTLLVSFIYIGFSDLPLEWFLIGEAIGAPTGIILLALSSPRARRR